MRARKQSSVNGLGRRLLRIAVVADTHLTEADGVCNSPFSVNKLANERLRYVVRSINRVSPDFAIHLGDIVHPVPAVPALFEQAIGCFREQIADLQTDLLLVPGNHDVGDKPIDWGPAGVICEDYVDLWDRYFGPNYQAVVHAGCHFIILNAQLINTGFASETRQREWLEAYLQTHEGGRFFVNLHYPPYLLDPEEREHYDNIAEPGRSWLLGLLESYRVEALFAGHVHHFWVYRHGVTDCYLLPSTAFARQDYSEMFRAAPEAGTEFGRNDVQKLGYLMLEVYEHGHLCRPIRTAGVTQSSAGETPAVPRALRLPFPPHPREDSDNGFGFDMRKDWLAPIEIPPSGGLDEFDRKSVRNDYPILALWEMGVRRLRIPRADLDSEDQRSRLWAMYAQGMRFTLFSYDVPDAAFVAHVAENAALLDAWEIAIPLHKGAALAGVLKPLRARGGPRIYLSKLRGKEDAEKHEGTYYHVINHGFAVDDSVALGLLCERDDLVGLIDGFVFRVGCSQPAIETILKAVSAANAAGKFASVHVRMGSENPAEVRWDEPWSTARVAEALVAAHASPSARVFVDTLADIDRGYFPRMGVLDALWNPRPASHVISSLNAFLSRDGGPVELGRRISTDQADFVLMETPQRRACLVLALDGVTQVLLPADCLPNSPTGLRAWDLERAHPIEFTPADGCGGAVCLTVTGAPILLSFA